MCVRLLEVYNALRPVLEVWKLPHLLGKGGTTPVADTSPLHLLPSIIEFAVRERVRAATPPPPMSSSGCRCHRWCRRRKCLVRFGLVTPCLCPSYISTTVAATLNTKSFRLIVELSSLH